MILINLMPHRHRQLALRRRRFMNGLSLTVLSACMLVLVASFVLERMQSQQRAHNTILDQAKLKLDQQEERGQALRGEVLALEQRHFTMTTLQMQRNVPIGLFNELAELTPPGLVLTAVRQNDLKWAISGVATSNERLSDFMAHLQMASTMLQGPELVEMRSVTPSPPRRLAADDAASAMAPETTLERAVEFTLQVQLRPEWWARGKP